MQNPHPVDHRYYPDVLDENKVIEIDGDGNILSLKSEGRIKIWLIAEDRVKVKVLYKDYKNQELL